MLRPPERLPLRPLPRSAPALGSIALRSARILPPQLFQEFFELGDDCLRAGQLNVRRRAAGRFSLCMLVIIRVAFFTRAHHAQHAVDLLA